MKRISVFLDELTAYVDDEESVIEIKTFKTEKEAQNFMEQIERAIEARVNALYLGERTTKEKIKDLQGMLKEDNSNDAKLLGSMLKMLDKNMK